MECFERVYQLHHLLIGRRLPIANKELQARLECSETTVKRLIILMRDRFAAPIVYDRQRNGYYYDVKNGAHPYELPGLWFNAEELWGLLTCHALLGRLSQGLFGDFIDSLQKRIEMLLAQDSTGAGRKLESVKIIAAGARHKGVNPIFNKVAGALFDKRQLHIEYIARGNGQISRRDVSPQTLVYYRDNWYLDAWCHSKNELRTFAVENIRLAERLNRPAKEMPRSDLDAYFNTSYSIFSGKAEHQAKLKFTPERARWVCDEHWHSEQQGRWIEDGSYELTIPFGDHRELLMDILKHGRHVEGLLPVLLRQAVQDETQAMVAVYQKNEGSSVG